MAEELKEWFNAERYRKIAADLGEIAPTFDQKRFLATALDGLEGRSLMERLRFTSTAVDSSLPGSFRAKVKVLQQLAPRIGQDFVGIFLSDFVAQFGLDDLEFSLGMLRFFTRFGSAEFAIRPFIVRDQEKTLATMTTWASDPDAHVRRLSSEGCRPRLPWGQRLQSLVKDPSPLGAILDLLRADDSLYVRKSVANNLNDIAKDHPDWMLSRLKSWDLRPAATAWIAKRAARTLIKQGHPETLTLFGFGRRASVLATLTAKPGLLRLGETLTLEAKITSTATAAQRLAIDYVVHYVKSSGTTSAKVFKWTEIDLPKGGSVILTKRQMIRDFTTRRHFAGTHRVDLQINGQVLADASFEVRTSSC